MLNLMLAGRARGCNNLTLSTLSDGTERVISPPDSSDEDDDEDAATPRASQIGNIDRSTYIVVKHVSFLLIF